jgi:hypothetical protein
MGRDTTVVRDLLELLMWLEDRPGFLQRIRQEMSAPVAPVAAPLVQVRPVTHQPLPPDSDLLTPAEAGKALGVDVGTLSNWRATKRVPLPYVKLGKAVRYRRQDLERFIAENTEGGA